jgi:putative ABC transport system permease protein
VAAAPDPTWGKAPLLLFRYPQILAGVAAAALILSAASATGPLFLSSAGSVALRDRIQRGSVWDAGLTVVQYAPLSGRATTESGLSSAAADLFHQRDEELHAAAALPHLAPEMLTILGSKVTLTAGTGAATPGSGSAAGSSGTGRVPRSPPVQAQLLTRTGFLPHLRPVDGGTGSAGVWLAESTATAVGVRAGDTVTLSVRQGTASAPVAGIYRDLSAGRLDAYWSPLASVIEPATPGQRPVPPLLASQDLFLQIGATLGDLDQFTWQFPLSAAPIGLPEADALAGELRNLGTRLSDPLTPQGKLFSDATHVTALPDLVEAATATLGGLQGPVGALTLAGRLVALVVLAAAGLYAVARRESEVRSLSARGVGAASLAVKGALEAALPVAAGAVAGWFVASRLVRLAGPGGAIDPAAAGAAAREAAATTVLGLVLLAVVAGLAARRQAESFTGRAREVVARTPWEPLVLVLAAAAFYELSTRGSAAGESVGGVPRVDAFLLLFPVLFVAGMAGLAARGLGRLLPWLRGTGSRGSAARYLAIRRLAGATRMALLLVTAGALAVGILVYAGTLTTSVRATTLAKARVLTGGDVAVPLADGARVPALAVPATRVDRLPGVSVASANGRVDLLGVDPGTFASVVRWDPGFASSPLSQLLRSLSPTGTTRLRVVIAGGRMASQATLDVTGQNISVQVVGSARAFPGMGQGRPTLVADRVALERAVSVATGRSVPEAGGAHELWARGDPGTVLRSLRRSGLPVAGAVSVERVRSSPSFLAVTWVFGLLTALGLMAGLVALAGLLLYLQARQRSREVAYALSSRMGLSRAAHRRSIALELGGMLGSSFVVGVALALVAARLVNARLDLLPQIPPGPVLRFPWLLLLAAAGVLVLVAAAGAWLVQRAADRADVAEVMRLAA